MVLKPEQKLTLIKCIVFCQMSTFSNCCFSTAFTVQYNLIVDPISMPEERHLFLQSVCFLFADCLEAVEPPLGDKQEHKHKPNFLMHL